MLIWIFGDVQNSTTSIYNDKTAKGVLELANATVNWLLSIDENNLPSQVRQQGKRSYRSLKIENQEFDFSTGFADLHTESYRQILAGNGFGIEETRKAIQTVYEIRR
jgi:UDP-N-acetyl-2-amino-2-deoxyglucuronate dehydrogenase